LTRALLLQSRFEGTAMRLAITGYIAAAALSLSACESMSPSERNTATGAGIGAVAGAVIGEDAGSAAIGALAGGAIGWYLGCREEGRCGNVDNRRQTYDQRSGRYYFYDEQSRRYFYENGEPYRG
jgi:uncharacterized membrane protein